MAYEFRLRRRVEFNETDAAGVVYFANYFRYCEAAEAAFLRSLSLALHHRDGRYFWPRADVRCKYIRPIFFDDEIEVHLLVARKLEKSLEYLFRIYVCSGSEQLLAAEASLAAVCANKDGPLQKLRARPLPPEVDEAIEEAPRESIPSNYRVMR